MFARFTPVDTLSLAFASVLIALTLFFINSIPHAGWLLLRYSLLVTPVIALSIAVPSRRAASWTARFRDFLPILIIPVFFDCLGDLIPWIHSSFYDGLLISIDRSLFGTHPTVWLERFIHPWLTTVMQLAYISYYPMAIVLAMTLYIQRQYAAFSTVVFGLVLCFYLSYMGYILVPAIGPRFTLAALQTRDLAAGPFVIVIQNMLNALENTKTDAFPSGHTAVALLTLYYARKMRQRILARLLTPVVAGLILSTVYLRYHYVIDVLAGIALTGVTAAVAPLLKRTISRYAEEPEEQFHEPA